MNIFTTIKRSINTFFEDVKQIKVDKDNRKKFVEEIGYEIGNVNSKFNTYGLHMDEGFKRISCYVSIPENYQLAGSDAMIYSKLKEEVRPVNEYIGKDIMWGEYFVAPEFYYVDDVEDPENVSCTYLAIWNYTPVLASKVNFKKQLFAFITINTLLIAGIVIFIILI